MAKITKIILQQMVAMDQTSITASRYPRYTVVLGNSISSITAGELTASVDAAAASAAAAKESEIKAKDSEINAKNSEQEAAISEQNAETSASQSAKSAADSLLEAGKSAASATESANSAVSAGEFRDSAEFSAQNAERSKDLADQAKAAAEEAARQSALSATESTNQATAAAGSATTAGEHAAAAKASELAAKESETNAAGSATTAGDKAVDATAEADRAKAEADRAAAVVDSKLDKEDISGFIKTYKTLEAAEADVANRVLGEKILVWSKTNSRYGWYKVAGTAEAPVLELESEESKLLSVNNVQPDEYGNVQVTLPGGNPSLWLGEVTWFPYDKDSGIGYSGVLPADGREVLRVDYPDTWEAIEAGLIPSVSEAEWQAGSKLYFSTGNGTTTFRLPDMMQGQAFRAADKNEDNAGAIQEQIPYITVINKKAPGDDGSITLGWNDIDGAVPVSKGGTGATTIDAAKKTLLLDRYRQTTSKGETYMVSGDGTKQFSVQDNGSWGVWDNANATSIALPITSGGTGSTSVDGARTNLKVNRLDNERSDLTSLYSTDGKDAAKLFVRNDGYWGVQAKSGAGNVALSVDAGGTGAVSVSQAQANLGVPDARAIGVPVTGMIHDNDANNIQKNCFFAGAGVDGVNYKFPYSMGIAMRRVNSTGQIQMDGEGGLWTRFTADGNTWTPWTAVVRAGDTPAFKTALSIETYSDAGTNASGILYLRAYSANGATERYYSRIYAEIRADGNKWLTLHLNNGAGQNKYLGMREDGYVAFPGAIGVTDDVTTRKNLKVYKLDKAGLGTVDLNTLDGSDDGPGIYVQSMSANAILARNYPEQTAGMLEVLPHSANGSSGCIQRYTPFTMNGAAPENGADYSQAGKGLMYIRSKNGNTTTWSPWYPIQASRAGNVSSTAGQTAATNYTDYVGKLSSQPCSMGAISVTGVGWITYMSARHRNGSGDGVNYGLVLEDIAMTSSSYNSIQLRKQNGSGLWQSPKVLWHTGNTTVDASGFVKKASPIVKIFNDGTFETNEESEGCTVERLGVGEYEIQGCLGLNADLAWGGVNGGIEIPKDMNGQNLVWVDYTVSETGSIIVKTYHREYPESPAFARNTKEGYANGDPIDIPTDVFISVRVEMPDDSVYNLKLKADEERAKELDNNFEQTPPPVEPTEPPIEVIPEPIPPTSLSPYEPVLE